MGENGGGEPLHVIGEHEVAPIEGRPGLYLTKKWFW